MRSDQIAYQIESGASEDQERQRNREHHGRLGVASLMTQQVLLHYLVEGAVAAHDQEEELQEHGLDIGKQENRDEGQA